MVIGGQSEVVHRAAVCPGGTELKSGRNLLESLHNFGAASGSVLNAMPLLQYSRNRHPVPIIQMAGWTSGPFWTDRESFALNICNFVSYLSRLSRASSVTLPILLCKEFIMQSEADVGIFSYLCSRYFL